MEHISVLNIAFSKAYSIATLCSYNRSSHSNGADSAARLSVVPHSSSSKNLYANRKSAFRRFILQASSVNYFAVKYAKSLCERWMPTPQLTRIETDRKCQVVSKAYHVLS